MRGVGMHRPGVVEVEELEDPRLVEPGDAVIRLAASCICGSDLWHYRGVVPTDRARMGHEYIGVVDEVRIPGIELFSAAIHTLGGPAPVRRFLPELIRLIWDGEIDPGRVFDLVLPLADAAEGYRAMDERRAIKTILTL